MDPINQNQTSQDPQTSQDKQVPDGGVAPANVSEAAQPIVEAVQAGEQAPFDIAKAVSLLEEKLNSLGSYALSVVEKELRDLKSLL